MQDFRKLEVWQEAQALAVAVHGATARLRGADTGILRTQLRRASQSIGAIIAEGADSDSQRRFAHYLQMAIGSASEVESHLDFAQRQELMARSEIAALNEAVVRLRRRTIALRKRVLVSLASMDNTVPKPKPQTPTRN